MKSAGRTYRQSARAAAAEATRERILDVAMRRWTADWYDEVSLRDIAADAGVALQTVVNHFGTKERLFSAGIERHRARVEAGRAAAAPDDVAAAVRAVVDEYEQTGDANVRAHAQLDRLPALAGAVADGRALHREWVAGAFPGALAGLRGAERERRILQLAVATNVLTWKHLRRDHGLSRDECEAAMRGLVEALYP